MTIKEFQECVEYNIEHNLKHAILGLGAPGVGKSQVIRQIGEKYGYKVIDIRLAQMSEVEIGGLIYPNENRTKTVWLAPEILPDVERDGEKTILLLDEITSCTKRVQVAAYQLILDRRVGQYKLPEGTFVVALGNREDDDGVYIQLADPLADRFEIHFIEPDFNSWKYDFALKNNIHPWIIDYLTAKPSGLHNQIPGDDTMVFATPRSWERVSDILNNDDNIENKIIQYKIKGNIGEKEGSQFVAYCMKHRQMVTADDYLEGRKKAPETPEEMNLLINALLSKIHFLTKADDMTALGKEQRAYVEKVISSVFRFPKAEYTIVAMSKIISLNRILVKGILCELDDDNIITFIKNNKHALGLSTDEVGEMVKKNAQSKILKMWK